MFVRSAFDERYVLSDQIYRLLSGMGQVVSPWECIDRELVGIDTSREDHRFLSGFALRQLAFALTMAERGATADIRKLVTAFFSEDDATRRAMSPSASKALVNIAVTKSVLNGQSALDLGCGTSPAFARTARTMGAKVYTADVVGVDKFESLSTTFVAEDESCHVVCDLNARNAAALILAAHGNERFDLVTTALANPEYGWNWSPQELAIVPTRLDMQRQYPNGRIPFVCKNARSLAGKLLKPGGFFFDASLPMYCQQFKV